jgi:hypothetical protein
LGSGVIWYTFKNPLPLRLQNGKPDSRSRRAEYWPATRGSAEQPIQIVLHKKHFEKQIKSQVTNTDNTEEKKSITAMKLPYQRWVNWDKNVLEQVKEETFKDEDYDEAMKILEKYEENSYDTLSQEEEVLDYRARLWVPYCIRTSVLESEHDSKVAGYSGLDTMKELIRRNFWLPKMNDDIIQYVQSCPDCQKNKVANHISYGLLQSLELVDSPWKSIAIDFITNLPWSEGCHEIRVMFHRFTIMEHFIRLMKNNNRLKISRKHLPESYEYCIAYQPILFLTKTPDSDQTSGSPSQTSLG